MMSDLLRFLGVLLLAAFVGCLGYWVGLLQAPNLRLVAPSLAGLGAVLGLVIGTFLNSGRLRRT